MPLYPLSMLVNFTAFLSVGKYSNIYQTF